MTAGDRDQLASAIVGFMPALQQPLDSGDAEMLADALLPTVDALIRQAQAAALESAARLLPDQAIVSDYDRRNGATRPGARDWLRARAAALRVSDDGRDVTQDAP